MAFQYDRFNAEKLLQSYNKASIIKGVIFIPDYDLEISLYDDDSDISSEIWEKYDFLIREILANLSEFDNSTQKDCEKKYKNSNLDLRNFLFSLQCLYIAPDKVVLDYWGDEVNSSFHVEWHKTTDGWVEWFSEHF
jgi:hypothetical protein